MTDRQDEQARAFSSSEWTVPAGSATVRDRLLEHCSSIGGKVDAQDERSLRWSEGSLFKIRIFGTWNVNPALLPSRVDVQWDTDGDETRVHAVMSEAAGQHEFDERTREIYETHLEASIARLEAASNGDTIAASDISTATLTKPGARYLKAAFLVVLGVIFYAVLKSLTS